MCVLLQQGGRPAAAARGRTGAPRLGSTGCLLCFRRLSRPVLFRLPVSVSAVKSVQADQASVLTKVRSSRKGQSTGSGVSGLVKLLSLLMAEVYFVL